MTEENNTYQEPQPQPSFSRSRGQERHERWMAKQAAHFEMRAARAENRAARRAAHAQRPHQDWTFEVRVGEKVYAFSWHWGQPWFQSQVEEDVNPNDLENGYQPEVSL